MTDRVCTLCKERKPASAFDGKTTYYCKPCRKVYRSSPKERRASRSLHLRREYGLTLEQFEQMVEDQGGRCYICGEIPEKILRVDHDHETGQIRKLLCDPCNSGLGRFSDDITKLLSAVEYLRMYQRGRNVVSS